MNKRGWLILEDGSVFEGKGIGTEKETVAGFVFNTGMTGHGDMLADPANAGLGIVTAFPVIGAWGAAFGGKNEAKRGAAGLVCRELSFCPVNNVKAHDINDFMVSRGITGLKDIDTRQLTRRLRGKGGSLKGMITFNESYDKAAILEAIDGHKDAGLVESVTSKNIEKRAGAGKNIAVLDLGCSAKIAAVLQGFKFGVTQFPAGSSVDAVLKDKPDGIVITEGPGDPADCGVYLPSVLKLMDSGLPVFGIGLGHQLMAAAKGFKTVRLPKGHRGANYPVKEAATGKMYITTQNHGYAVDAGSVNKNTAKISYTNIHDGSVEGLEYNDGLSSSLQYFPETGPYALKPNAAFMRFIERVSEGKGN